MSRMPRIVLPGIPHHVVHQGHNKRPLFEKPADFEFYLANLAHIKAELGCKLHFLVLMTTHSHLAIDPGEDAANLARLMQRLAGRYTRYFNRTRGTTGTAWNGRYFSSPIDTDRYFFACARYIELNPVRASMVTRPEDYRWSSHRHWAGLGVDWDWLDEHPLMIRFGRTIVQRRQEYRKWILSSIPEGESDFIRSKIWRGHPVGGERFTAMIEERLGRLLELRSHGRPRKRDDV